MLSFACVCARTCPAAMGVGDRWRSGRSSSEANRERARRIFMPSQRTVRCNYKQHSLHTYTCTVNAHTSAIYARVIFYDIARAWRRFRFVRCVRCAALHCCMVIALESTESVGPLFPPVVAASHCPALHPTCRHAKPRPAVVAAGKWRKKLRHSSSNRRRQPRRNCSNNSSQPQCVSHRADERTAASAHAHRA